MNDANGPSADDDDLIPCMDAGFACLRSRPLAARLCPVPHRDLLDPRIRAVLPIAPAFGCAFVRAFYRHVRVPLLVLQGDADRLAPLDDNARRVFHRASGPRTLAVLDGGSHLGFIAIAGVLGTPANIDQFGCNAVGSAAFPPLPGGAGAGVVSDACAPPCQPPLPTPTLDFSRQHDLTRIVAAAFFDAYLGGDQSAACWLAHGFAAENPDVQTRRRSEPPTSPPPTMLR
jgi:predicted dienelactone hydrolase